MEAQCGEDSWQMAAAVAELMLCSEIFESKCPKLSKTQMLTAKHWLFPAYPEMVFFAAELRKLPK